VAAVLDGCRTGEVAQDGSEVTGDSVLLLINASPEEATFTVPESAAATGGWTPRIDTATLDGQPVAASSDEKAEAVADISAWHAGEQHVLPAHSMMVLTQSCHP
jgi:glycogen operon protein